MSQPVVRYWAPTNSNTATISSLQNYSGAGNLIINNNVPGSYPGSPYVYDSIARSVSFTSANNLSGVTLTINGLGSAVDGSGNPTQPFNTSISENVVGPNANTVYSTNIFTQINSISISGAANGISAGFGNKGIMMYIGPDYDRSAWYATGQGAIYNRTTMTYTVYQSLTKPQTPVDGRFENYPLVIPAFSLGTVGATVNQLINYPTPVALTWVTIAAATGETFYYTFLQQGIK